MSRDDKRSLGWASWVVAVLGMLLLYVLSYAPVMRMTATHIPPGTYISPGGTRVTIGKLTIYQTRQWCYAPARWITASTPLREPLLMWADLWGMREIVESQRP